MGKSLVIRPKSVDQDPLILRAPPSKSEALRALVLLALAEGGHVGGLGGELPEDVVSLVEGLRALGYVLDRVPEGFAGGARRSGPPPELSLDAGEGAAPARFLLAVAALESTPVTVTGSPRLSERDHGPLAAALGALGAEVEGGPGLPIRVRGPLRGGRVEVDGRASSQHFSALALVAPRVRGGLVLSELQGGVSREYLDLTKSLLSRFGVSVTPAGHVDPFGFRAAEVQVEPDWSGATILLAASAFLGSAVHVPGLCLDSLQPDRAFLDLLMRIGFRVLDTEGGVTVSCARVFGGTFDLLGMPDAAPALLCLGALAEEPLGVRGAAHLRGKECDRIAALGDLLLTCGASVTEHEDGLIVNSKVERSESSRPVELHVRGDHRMVMAAALLGLLRPVRVATPNVVRKSFPGFFDQWPAQLASEDWGDPKP